MMWLDYTVESFPDGSFTVRGDWPKEAWQDKDGNLKQQPLYKPGDVFIVDNNGILRKTDEVNALLMKYESKW